MALKLSIGSAIYNLEESFLREHIEGILGQLTDETELLLIDDCSTNHSPDICKEYAAKDPRIRYIRMDENSGLSSVRNRTVEEAEGEWIFFADGDDLFSDYFISTALKFMDEKYDIIIHERLKFTEQKQPDSPCRVKNTVELPPQAGKKISISCLCLDPNLGTQLGLPPRAFYHAAWGAFYRKDFLVKNHLLFPVGQKKAQDAVFNTRTYFYAQNIAYLPYIMYYYRNNPQGITHRYTENLQITLASLEKHLSACMQEYYPHDADVRERFVNHRIMAIIMDNLRLNIFHKDNPKSREQRKREYFNFIEEEPYKTAISVFDPQKSGRWEWHLPVKLIQSKNFRLLDFFFGNNTVFRYTCALDRRVYKKLKGKK